MARDPKTIEVDGHRYMITIMPAGEGLRLLGGWTEARARMHEALADDTDRQRLDLPPWIDGEGHALEPGTITALRSISRAHRERASVMRAQASALLTPAAVRDTLIPTLRYAILLHDGDGEAPEVAKVWEAHFAGRISALLEVAHAVAEHNFADFFGGSTGAGADEQTQASPRDK